MSKEYTENDLIGRKEITDKICYLVDYLPPDSNFCLALNGKWGSGKSHVLHMVQEQLQEHDEYIVIHYDAWKNNFYSDPLIAILYCILDKLKEYNQEVPQGKGKKIVAEVAKEVCATVVNVICEKCKIFEKAVEGIKKIIKACKNAELTSSKEFGEYKSYLTLLNEITNILNDITEFQIIEGRQTKIIVLVDEIDRCLPNDQLLVLERLHHIFEIKNCAVIVAVNRDAIITNFKTSFGGDGDEYLRKFFNYNFSIKANELILLGNRIREVFDNINDKRSEPILAKDMDFIIRDIIEVSKDVFANGNVDNRKVDKFITVGMRVLEGIINYHPVMMLFALRMLLYKMFSDTQYRSITDPIKDDFFPFTDLQQFNGDNLPIRTSKRYYLNGLQTICLEYMENRYNNLLALFNLCKMRNINDRINIEQIIGKGLSGLQGVSKSVAIQNITTILQVIDRYGDM